MRHARFLALFIAILALGSAAWPRGQGGAAGQGAAQGGGRGAAPPGALPAAPPPVGTGFIAGQVIDVVSGKGIPEATVSMSGRAAGPPGVAGGRGGVLATPVIADAQGRFFFGNLPAGAYTIAAVRTGYVPPRIGAQLLVELGEAGRVIDGRVRLAKSAALSGTLRDDVGDPVVGTDVVVIRRTIVNGRQSVQAVAKARSDDRGMYRAGNLAYGDYFVCACSRDPIPIDTTLLSAIGSDPLQLMNVATRALSGGSDVVSIDNTLRTFPATFYPNSTTLARATRVALAPGDEKTGIDMNLGPVRATRVSGTVVGAQGPVTAQSMRLVPSADADAGADLFSFSPLLVQPDGRFDFAMVPPGQYRLLVLNLDSGGRGGGPSGSALSLVGARGSATPVVVGATMSGGPAPSAAPPLWANEPVSVGENGVTGLAVALNRPPSVTGRVQWVGAAPQPPAQMLQRATVQMQPVNFSDPIASMGGAWTGRFSPDATFIVPGAVPGKYIVSSNALPGYPTLKSVMVGGLDLTDLPFEVTDKDIADVVITYVDTPMATLTVTTNALAGSMPYDDAYAMVFPADRKYWTEPAAAGRRYRSSAVSTRGSVAIPNLPAGDYFVLVVNGLDSVDWQEAAKLEALARRAQRISLGEGESKAIEVRR